MDTLLSPHQVLLEDGSFATIYPVWDGSHLPLELIASLCVEYNSEIDKGQSFPATQRYMLDSFEKYWFSGMSGVLIKGQIQNIEDFDILEENECLGSFSIHPAFPGRSSHLCTVSILVKSKFRNQGIGYELGSCFLDWAVKLGYNYAYIPLVYATNLPACKLLENLHFTKLSVLKGAGILKGYDLPVDGNIYGKEIDIMLDEELEIGTDQVAPPAAGQSQPEANPETDYGIEEYKNFMNIKNYLESGKYPENATTVEKTRIRSRARSYTTENGVLKYKRTGNIVVMNPTDQITIVSDLHNLNHNGINKMQKAIMQNYFWTRIRDTIQLVIQNCDRCKTGTTKTSNNDEIVYESAPNTPALSYADDESVVLGPDDIDDEDIEQENEDAINLFDNIVYLNPENEDDDYIPDEEFEEYMA